MAEPIASKPRCDVRDGLMQFACSHDATYCTDGSEKDVATRSVPVTLPSGAVVHDVESLNRPAIPHLNVCEHHRNWPHSADAERFAATDEYKKRVATLKGK